MNTDLRSNRRGAPMRAGTLLALVAVTALVAACGREHRDGTPHGVWEGVRFFFLRGGWGEEGWDG